jgi:methionyl-tRNA formyltransferase
MKISVVCSSIDHPVYPPLRAWAQRHAREHDIRVEKSSADLHGGDILFLLSCHELIGKGVRERYRKSLLLHASDLPRGRGWSPHIWAVLDGQKSIVLTLLEVADPFDTGDIWKQTSFELEGHELYDEINAKLFQAEFDLMDFAIENFTTVSPVPQAKADATYYRQRTPSDSKIDIDISIREQFALLRVADPNRYPAFFEKDGYLYDVILRKRPG